MEYKPRLQHDVLRLLNKTQEQSMHTTQMKGSTEIEMPKLWFLQSSRIPADPRRQMRANDSATNRVAPSTTLSLTVSFLHRFMPRSSAPAIS